MFAASAQAPKPEEDDGEDSDGAVAPDANEAPVYAEAEKVKFAEGVQIQKSPYTKVLDVSPAFPQNNTCVQKKVTKFKIVAPKDRQRKLDAGSVTLEYMETPQGKRQYILVFKTALKPLYVGQISDKSKFKRVEEKAAKNQVKTAQVYRDPRDSKMVLTYCTINFNKFEEMEEFEKLYKKAIDESK